MARDRVPVIAVVLIVAGASGVFLACRAPNNEIEKTW
jgi:hypothetical protein